MDRIQSTIIQPRTGESKDDLLIHPEREQLLKLISDCLQEFPTYGNLTTPFFISTEVGSDLPDAMSTKYMQGYLAQNDTFTHDDVINGVEQLFDSEEDKQLVDNWLSESRGTPSAIIFGITGFLEKYNEGLLKDYSRGLQRDPTNEESKEEHQDFDDFLENIRFLNRKIINHIVQNKNDEQLTFYAKITKCGFEEIKESQYLNAIHWLLFSDFEEGGTKFNDNSSESIKIKIIVPKGCRNASKISHNERSYLLIPPYSYFKVKRFKEGNTDLVLCLDNKQMSVYLRRPNEYNRMKSKIDTLYEIKEDILN